MLPLWKQYFISLSPIGGAYHISRSAALALLKTAERFSDKI